MFLKKKVESTWVAHDYMSHTYGEENTLSLRVYSAASGDLVNAREVRCL